MCRLDGEDGDMLPLEGSLPGAVMVASEPITRRREDWVELPANHTLAIDTPGGSALIRSGCETSSRFCAVLGHKPGTEQSDSERAATKGNLT